MKKKNMSLFLACAMTMGMATSALAAGQNEQIVEAFGDTDVSASADVNLEGKVVQGNTLISVVMPTSIDFSVGTVEKTGILAQDKTSGTMDGNGGYIFAELISGEGTVTNNSNVAIKMELVGLADGDGLLGYMDLGLATGSTTTLTAGNKLDAAADYATSPIVLAASIADKDSSNNTTTLKVVGAAAKVMSGGLEYDVKLPAGNYTIATTMKVSAAQ